MTAITAATATMNATGAAKTFRFFMGGIYDGGISLSIENLQSLLWEVAIQGEASIAIS